MVCGDDAIRLLGGLSQIMPWLENGDEDLANADSSFI
jgi:hypothetical protein